MPQCAHAAMDECATSVLDGGMNVPDLYWMEEDFKNDAIPLFFCSTKNIGGTCYMYTAGTRTNCLSVLAHAPTEPRGKS